MATGDTTVTYVCTASVVIPAHAYPGWHHADPDRRPGDHPAYAAERLSNILNNLKQIPGSTYTVTPSVSIA